VIKLLLRFASNFKLRPYNTARCVGNEASVSVAASFVDEATLDEFTDAYAEFSAMQSLVAVGAGTMI